MKQHSAHRAPKRGWDDAHKKWRIYVAHKLKQIAQQLQKWATAQGTILEQTRQKRRHITEQIVCYGCERHLGTLAFDRQAVYNFRQRPTQRSPTCYTCQERLAIIQMRMNDRDAWRCTCQYTQKGRYQQQLMQVVPKANWRTALAWKQQPLDRI